VALPEEGVTMWELVERAAAEHPDRVLVADEHGRSLTAAGLRDRAEEVAAGLAVGPGDVVSWQLPTVLESAVLLVALARVGAVQNPIIPMLREREVRHIAAQVGTTVLVVPETWRGFGHGAMARSLADELGFAVVELDLDGPPPEALRLPTATGALVDPPADPHGCRWIYFTSGTTASPKGVRHTDASVIASSFGMTDGLGIADGDVYPIAWPVTHIGGATMLASVLRAGGTLVLFDAFDPATIGERMARVQPTILGTGVPFFRAYLDAQARHGAEPLYPRLRTFVAGGAPTPPELVRELRDAFGSEVVNSYGLTEFPIAASASTTDPLAKLRATVGRPAPGVEVRLVEGELRLRGPQGFLGYVDTELDAAAFDEEGWLRTGDLAEVDDDGYLTITGRLKDVIIRNGENVSALEVEDVLLRHPDVVDVAVIGLPDRRTGERVCAVVVARPGARVDVAAVAEHCAAQGMPRQKVPEQVELVEAIERNPMGKALKEELRQRILGSAP
jgi:acyl-CoA synthetase (AMP-forming)/AMP-acid ligase II